MAQLLRRFQQALERIEDERKLGKILQETGDVPAVTRATAAGDGRRLRGIPAVSRWVGGCIPGTQPEAALLAKETQRRRP